MERIGEVRIKEESLQLSSVKTSLTTRSGPSLPEGMGLALLGMMKQTCDRYPNQVIPTDSQEMYLVEWEEMALKYGLPMFREGLSKAIRDSKFFPDPTEVREHMTVLARKASIERQTQEMTERYEADERRRAENPDDYTPAVEFWREVSGKLKDRPASVRSTVVPARVPEPTHCPSCQAVIPSQRAIYMMSIEEIESYLRLKKEMTVQADANREYVPITEEANRMKVAIAEGRLQP